MSCASPANVTHSQRPRRVGDKPFSQPPTPEERAPHCVPRPSPESGGGSCWRQDPRVWACPGGSAGPGDPGLSSSDLSPLGVTEADWARSSPQEAGQEKQPADAGERPAAQGRSPSPRPGPQAVLCLQAAPRWAVARPRETRLDPGWTRASACTAGKRVPAGPAALAHGRRRCTCRRAPARRVLPTWTRQPGRRPVASSGPDSSQTS